MALTVLRLQSSMVIVGAGGSGGGDVASALLGSCPRPLLPFPIYTHFLLPLPSHPPPLWPGRADALTAVAPTQVTLASRKCPGVDEYLCLELSSVRQW